MAGIPACAIDTAILAGFQRPEAIAEHLGADLEAVHAILADMLEAEDVERVEVGGEYWYRETP